MTLDKIKGIIAEQLGVDEEDAEKFQTVSDIVNYVESRA